MQNNVTHATDWRNPRKHVWEIHIRSDFSYPDRIMMTRLLAGVELYQIWKVSDTKWIGFCKRVSLRRNIRIILDSTDIKVIEKAIGRKLKSVEVFEGLDEIDIQPRYYRGLTLHGVDTANIGKGTAYRSDFVVIAVPTKLQRMQWILNTLRQRRDLCRVQDNYTSIRIECRDTNRAAIESLIAGLTDGIAIVWKTYTVQPFYGTIEDSAQKLAS